jgi:hypothetical protein
MATGMCRNLATGCSLFLALAAAATPAAAQGRLFAVPYEESALPGAPGALEVIVELDPFTGVELNRFVAPIPPSYLTDGLAFDGTDLWYMAPQEVGGERPPVWQLFRLDPDSGEVRDSWIVTDDEWGVFYGGLAAVGGRIYIENFYEIRVFDPLVGAIVEVLDLATVNPGEISLAAALAGIDDPDRLLAVTMTGEGLDDQQWELLELDPATGVISGGFPLDVTTDTGSWAGGAAAVNRWIYVGWEAPFLPEAGPVTPITIYQRDGTPVGGFDLPYFISALGGNPAPEQVEPPPTPSVLEIPALEAAGLALLALLLAGAGLLAVRR